MNKISKIFLLLIICLFIASCGKKTEYKLTEMTSKDLLANINANNKLVFAFVNDENDDYKAFMNDLQNIVNNTHINIYYIDFNHMDSSSFAFLYDNYYLNYDQSSYYVYEDKNFVVEENYTNYQDLYSNLKNYTFLNDLIITSDEDLTENFNSAKEEYENGNIGLAKNYLDLSWTLEESKNFYKDHNEFQILNSWERYEFDDIKTQNYVTYQSIFFLPHDNYYVEATKSGKYENFEKPNSIDDYNYVYYYLKDGIIYTAKSDKTNREDYKATYEIIDFDKELLHLKDLKTNKTYEYLRGV